MLSVIKAEAFPSASRFKMRIDYFREINIHIIRSYVYNIHIIMVLGPSTTQSQACPANARRQTFTVDGLSNDVKISTRPRQVDPTHSDDGEAAKRDCVCCSCDQR